MPKKPLTPTKNFPDFALLLGKRIAELRKVRQLSQDELAVRIGVVQSVLARYESGAIRISADMIPRLASAMKVPISKLFDFEHILSSTASSPKLIRRFRRIEALKPDLQKDVLRAIDAALHLAEGAGG